MAKANDIAKELNEKLAPKLTAILNDLFKEDLAKHFPKGKPRFRFYECFDGFGKRIRCKYSTNRVAENKFESFYVMERKWGKVFKFKQHKKKQDAKARALSLWLDFLIKNPARNQKNYNRAVRAGYIIEQETHEGKTN